MPTGGGKSLCFQAPALVREGALAVAAFLCFESGRRAVGDNPLLRELGQLCGKERLLEIVHDFIVFDAGIKKTCRHNQYFGVRAAQERVRAREGGIVWHTQGSGKSLIMVWLAKWIREHVQDARVLIITDRTELDEQIEEVFKGVSEAIYRTKSGADLVRVLNASEEWLIGSLVHKFGASEEGDIDAFLKDIQSHLPKGFRAKGEIFVFVDECHRSQSGKLHDAMKALLPGAMLIGFTGTPLLKSDKRRSIETFGPYIHTYKYDEAVRDRVVLDLLPQVWAEPTPVRLLGVGASRLVGEQSGVQMDMLGASREEAAERAADAVRAAFGDVALTRGALLGGAERTAPSRDDLPVDGDAAPENP